MIIFFSIACSALLSAIFTHLGLCLELYTFLLAEEGWECVAV